jgi:hypothetical protein
MRFAAKHLKETHQPPAGVTLGASPGGPCPRPGSAICQSNFKLCAYLGLITEKGGVE